MADHIRAIAVLTVVLIVGIMVGSALTTRGSERPSDAASNRSAADTAAEWPRERLRVEVLNAGGTAGLAQRATGVLRDSGLDVVYWGNDAQFSDSASRVVDRVGDTLLARAVADALGIEHVLSEVDSTRLVEATVKLGPVWSFEVAEPPPLEAELTPWWDLRRYFR